ncbi:DUF2497 domain-containing protein [Bartonella sp. CB178]|uniref:DUF2497 domain-containing protein n=1 Tax=Bartonella sp. CB178 TaxID=3112255 RepID=UPI00300E58CD
MVQSSSVLREPSMDEILTSIREIIEENAVHPDYLSNEGIAANAPADRSVASSGGGDDATLSVDDAMRALADRIGLSSENQDFSSVQDNTETENGTVMGKQNMKISSEEQRSVHKQSGYSSGEALAPRSENVASDHVELSAYCVSSAEKIAKDVLRPAIAEWLQSRLPVLLEDILREEIVKAIKKAP